MSRYGFQADETEVVVGWDNPCQTLFGQTEVGGEIVVDTMCDMGRFNVLCIVELEKLIGFSIPPQIHDSLMSDRDNTLPQTPLQAFVGTMFEEG